MSEWGSWGGTPGPGGGPPPPAQPWGPVEPPAGPYAPPPYQQQPYQQDYYDQPGWGPSVPPPGGRQGRGPLIAVLVVVGVVLLGGAGILLVSSSGDDDGGEEAAATTLPPGAGSTTTPPDPATTTTTGITGEVDIFQLGLGDCWDDPSLSDANEEVEEIESATIVACAEPHDLEVYAVYDVTFTEFPGQDQIAATAEDDCIARFTEFVGRAYRESRYYVTTLYPTQESWDGGDREVVCSIYDANGPTTGSLQGADQ